MRKMRRRLIRIVFAIVICCALVVGGGIANADKETKTWAGAGIGALAGGLITGNWTGAAAGAVVGGVAGNVMGTEEERHKEKMALERERLAIEKAKVTNNPKTAYRPANRNPLVGSTWRVISIEGDQPYPEYNSIVATFQTNSKLTTLTAYKDGSSQAYVETYQVLDDVLVITGQEDGKKYVVNGKYSLSGKQLVFVTPTYRIVCEEIDRK